MQFMTAPLMQDPVQATWTLLRFASQPLSIADIIFDATFPQRFANGELAAVISAINDWSRTGLVASIHKTGTFTMSQAAKSLRKPPHGSGGAAAAPARQRIWSAIKVLRRFDLVQLRLTAEVSPRYAREVLNQLTRAGYLAKDTVDRGDPPRWRVIRPTGPHHPTIEYVRKRPVALRDRMTGERFDLTASSSFFLTPEVNHVG